MVQRAKHQHGVNRIVSPVQIASVAGHGGLNRADGARPFHMARHWINEVGLISERSQPSAVYAGCSADVQHRSGRLRQALQNQLLRARQFQKPPALREPQVLAYLFVMFQDFLHHFCLKTEMMSSAVITPVSFRFSSTTGSASR